MADLQNELFWSFSRSQIFKQCKRRYYYRHYLFWNGWDSAAPEENQLAYRLSKIQTVDMFVGQLVHNKISEVAIQIAGGRVPNWQEDSVLKQLEWAFQASANRQWMEAPKRYPNLFEDYYRGGLTDEQKDAARNKAASCLRRFKTSAAYRGLLQNAGKSNWIWISRPDILQHFVIDTIKVFASPDTVVQIGTTVHIFEWKTGHLAPEIREQLMCYALFVHHSWGYRPTQLIGHAISLVQDREAGRHVFREDELQAMRERIRDDYTAMRDCVDEQNIACCDNFPRTEQKTQCGQCNFFELCDESGG